MHLPCRPRKALPDPTKKDNRMASDRSAARERRERGNRRKRGKKGEGDLEGSPFCCPHGRPCAMQGSACFHFSRLPKFLPLRIRGKGVLSPFGDKPCLPFSRYFASGLPVLLQFCNKAFKKRRHGPDVLQHLAHRFKHFVSQVRPGFGKCLHLKSEGTIDAPILAKETGLAKSILMGCKKSFLLDTPGLTSETVQDPVGIKFEIDPSPCRAGKGVQPQERFVLACANGEPGSGLINCQKDKKFLLST